MAWTLYHCDGQKRREVGVADTKDEILYLADEDFSRRFPNVQLEPGQLPPEPLYFNTSYVRVPHYQAEETGV